MADGVLLNKLRKGRVWRKIGQERLTEPVTLNLASLFVWGFGSYRQKVTWDLVVRQPYAYGVLKAADLAKAQGCDTVTLIEFGVASGFGLVNMARIAERVTRETGVRCEIHGFDTGAGMPPPVDFRDHPDLYQDGDFAADVVGLREVLPANVTLHIGELRDTVPAFVERLTPAAPVGFVALDVDYYSSTVDALEVFSGSASGLLPRVVVYVDDIALEAHNSAAGETLAIAEFNAANPLRRLEFHRFFEDSRIFRRAQWVRQMMFLHVMDHPARQVGAASHVKRYVENPYLKQESRTENFHSLS